MPPRIDNPKRFDLPPDAIAILQEMFKSYQQMTIRQDLTSFGYGGSWIYVVQAIKDDQGPPELPVVVKISSTALATKEWQAYRDYVKDRLPNVARIKGAPVFCKDKGGLCYGMVGEGTFDVQTLGAYGPTASIEDLVFVIREQLLPAMRQLWRFGRYTKKQTTLHSYYDRILPVNLLIEPDRLPQETEIILLNPDNLSAKPLDVGDRLRLAGFQVVKTNARCHTVTLNSPSRDRDDPQSYVVRLRDVQDVDTYQFGQIADAITGTIVETRQSRLQAEVQDVLQPDFDLKQETLTNAEGLELPNPIKALPDILDQLVPVWRSYIHGDLNLGNILIELKTRRVGLIDFAEARQDYVLHDFLRLETETVTHLLAEVVHRHQLPPAKTMYGFYQQLHWAICESKSPLPELPHPDLQGPFEMLKAIRQAVQRYLFKSNDYTEYYRGLVIYLIGALKFSNLNTASTAPVPKQLALWGAATIQQLLDAPPLFPSPEPDPPKPDPPPEPNPTPNPTLLDRINSLLIYVCTRLHWDLCEYRKQYLECLISQHRFFKVGTPFPLEVEEVFVELDVEVGAERPEKDLIPPNQRDRKGKVVWDYIDSQRLARHCFAIVGPPGIGKTAMLQHIVLTLAKETRELHNLRNKLPVLLSPEHTKKIASIDSNHSLAQLVQNTLPKNLQIPASWFQKQLERGHCLVMLDGLDEIADIGARERVLEWMHQQRTMYPQNCFLLTSRPFAFWHKTSHAVTPLKLQFFSDEQVKRFVDRWFDYVESLESARPEGTLVQAEEKAENLLRQINSSSALFDLAVNPLLLTMIVASYRPNNRMPIQRAELYEWIFSHLLAPRSESGLTVHQKRHVLEPLAYHLMCQERLEISSTEALEVIKPFWKLTSPQPPETDFFRKIAQESSLLKQKDGVCKFAHLTFQAYLAATYIKEQNLIHELVERIQHDWWHETIRLYVAQADATPVIAACLANDPPAAETLKLASECLAEAKEIQPSVRDRFEDVLTTGVESDNPERRQVFAEAHLILRLGQLYRVNVHKCIDSSLISQAEYQLFLDERRERGMYHQPDHWHKLQFLPGQGQTPIVGVRPSDAVAFCRWLTNRESGNWEYRLPHIDELGSIAADQVATYWAIASKGLQLKNAGHIQTPNTSQLAVWVCRDLGLALARDLIRYQNLVCDSIDALEHVRTYAQDLADVFAHACTHNNPADLEQFGNFMYNLANTLEGMHEKAKYLLHSLDRTFDRVDKLESIRELDHANAVIREVELDLNQIDELVCNLGLELERRIDLSTVREYFDKLAQTMDQAPSIDPKSVQDPADKLAFAINRISILNRTLGQNPGRKPEHTLTLIHSRLLNCQLARPLDLDRHGNSKLAFDFNLERARARNLKKNIKIAFDLAQRHNREIARVLASSLEREIELTDDLIDACTSDSPLARILASDSYQPNDLYTLVRRLKEVCDQAQGLTANLTQDNHLAHDLGKEIEDALSRARALIQAIAIDLERVLARAIACSHICVLTLIRTHDLESAVTITRSLSSLVDPHRTSLIDLIPSNHADEQTVASILRWHIRFCTISFAAKQPSEYWKYPLQILGRDDGNVRAREEEIRRLNAFWLDFYIDMVMLEERIVGELKAFEGICIVKVGRLRTRRPAPPCRWSAPRS